MTLKPKPRVLVVRKSVCVLCLWCRGVNLKVYAQRVLESLVPED